MTKRLATPALILFAAIAATVAPAAAYGQPRPAEVARAHTQTVHDHSSHTHDRSARAHV